MKEKENLPISFVVPQGQSGGSDDLTELKDFF
jgi:hypothetical protein